MPWGLGVVTDVTGGKASRGTAIGLDILAPSPLWTSVSLPVKLWEGGLIPALPLLTDMGLFWTLHLPLAVTAQPGWD